MALDEKRKDYVFSHFKEVGWLSVCTADFILSFRKVSSMSFNLFMEKVKKSLMKT